MRSTLALMLAGGLILGGLRLVGLGRDPSETAARNAYILAQADRIEADAERVWVAAGNDRLDGEQKRTFAADWHELWLFVGWAGGYVGLGLIGLGGIGLLVWLLCRLFAIEQERRLAIEVEFLRAQAEQLREKRRWLAWVKAQRDSEYPAPQHKVPGLLPAPQPGSSAHEDRADVRVSFRDKPRTRLGDVP